MGTRPADTSGDTWARVEAALRAMTPGERVQRAVALTILHSFALGSIRQQHPEEDDRKHRLRLAARFLDPSTMKNLGFVDDRSV